LRRLTSNLVLFSLFVFLAGLNPVHAISNGDFESLPNHAWLRDGPIAPRLAKGDRAAIVLGANGNHYGHLGDIDGRGADGENPSRFFQWFRCADSTSVGQDCVIEFRFRALLLPGEFAWVRVQSATQMRALKIPHSNNQWAAFRPRIVLPGGCDQGLNFLDLGMLNTTGAQVGGRLSVDTVVHRSVTAQEVLSNDRDWNDLPDIPLERDSEHVPLVEIVPVVPTAGGSLTLSILILMGVGLFLVKLRR
jgi:hypothetical protein